MMCLNMQVCVTVVLSAPKDHGDLIQPCGMKGLRNSFEQLWSLLQSQVLRRVQRSPYFICVLALIYPCSRVLKL